MRHLSLSITALTTALALSACSGGGGGTPGTPGGSPGTTSSNTLVAPTFALVIPKPVTSAAGDRTPNFVSSATGSVTITLTNPPPGLAPTSVTSPVSGASCTAANPCVVNGPPSPPGVADTFLVQTFQSADGTGPVLDTGTVTITPTAGQANSTTIVLKGVPSTIAISNVPTFAAGTAGQSQALTITVKDAAGVVITGTYSTPVLVTSPDTSGTQGTQITGTPPAGGCAGTTTCAQISSNTDAATLAYGGLAESPVTLTASASGVTNATATFTPTLASIVHSAGPVSLAAGSPFGVDLFTSNAASTVGYSGTESYSEAGFTTAPYNKALTATASGAGCGAFATVASAANTTTHVTDFTATSIASPVSGQCTLTVGDGITGQTSAPTFVVTYTSSGISANAKSRNK